MKCTIRQLEIFIAVVDEGGFSAAGERLHMVQPAVSIAVRKLEEAARLRLLKRSSQGTELTQEGKVFLAHARSICGQIERLEDQLTDMRQLTVGQVSVGCPPALSAFFLPRLVDAFLKRHPRVRFTVVEDRSDAIAARVKAGELDVGIIPGTLPPVELETVILEDAPVVCAAAETSPLAKLRSVNWETVLDQPLILFPRKYNQRGILDAVVSRLGIQPKIAIEAESWFFQLELVRAGQGVALMFADAANLASGVVCLPIEEKPTIPVSICRNSGAGHSLSATAFFESVVEDPLFARAQAERLRIRGASAE